MRVNPDVTVERAIPYGHGKLLDVYRPGPGGGEPTPTVLVWHGVGLDERDVLETLATSTAGYGLTVVVPDWRSDAPDEGRAHLLTSLDFTRSRALELGGLGADALVLAGWSRGGRSAAAVGVRPEVVGGLAEPRRVRGLALFHDLGSLVFRSYVAAACRTASTARRSSYRG